MAVGQYREDLPYTLGFGAGIDGEVRTAATAFTEMDIQLTISCLKAANKASGKVEEGADTVRRKTEQ